MRKLFYVFAIAAAIGLVACVSQPTQQGDSSATAPSTMPSAPAPAASCGGSGKG